MSHIFINLTCRGGGALPTDDQHGRLRPESIGNAGDRISSARTGGDDGDARLASDARPGVGGVRRGLLVPHVNDFDAFVEAAVVNVNNVPPAEGVKMASTPSAFRARATRWPPLISVMTSILLECP